MGCFDTQLIHKSQKIAGKDDISKRISFQKPQMFQSASFYGNGPCNVGKENTWSVQQRGKFENT